ncbi:MAG: bifunctional diaminohydroxyphosphoribosylaminopyrimidine deaminase/5-amino-6-(5-phosphoribosylamino)uracil reductase RibD, partial [Polyangiaceae bacterium]|nr:bifunctional diaminohydroxyphosphoribosylaminopyrimidine deaminase/5-amino-6-(5-phosphoribosylamino)uracil reductase RibD [Polyangiaceae bacterium]
IARVVVAQRDPNPNVPGKGIERLRAAGIEVLVSVCEKESAELIETWTQFITTGSSFLSLKLALSLDGRIATRTGASKWITSAESRAYGHELRARHDAVMVGINTVLADDPQLTVRATKGPDPVRVIVDSKLRLPTDSQLFQTARDIPTCVLTTEAASEEAIATLEEGGLSVILLPATAEGRCDMSVALQELAKREVVSVLCEGGAELAGSLLAGQLVDRLHAFMAPILLGPRGRPGAVDWAGPETPAEAPRIASPQWSLHGNDAHVTGRLQYSQAGR